MGLEWGIRLKGISEEGKLGGSHPRCLFHPSYSPPLLEEITPQSPFQYMVVGRAEGEGGRGRGKRGPSKRGKKKGVGGEGRGGGGVPPGVQGLLVAGEQGVDDGGQQQVLTPPAQVLLTTSKRQFLKAI